MDKCEFQTYFLENKDLGANLPPPKLPATEYVGHVVVHSVYEEEVPPLETLAEDCHFTEAATRATAGDEDCSRGFRFDKDVRAHLDSRSQFAGYVAKEPILGNAEARVLVKSVDEEFAVPERDGTVGESRRSNLAGKLALDATELVLKILSLLAKVSFR